MNQDSIQIKIQIKSNQDSIQFKIQFKIESQNLKMCDSDKYHDSFATTKTNDIKVINPSSIFCCNQNECPFLSAAIMSVYLNATSPISIFPAAMLSILDSHNRRLETDRAIGVLLGVCVVYKS